MPFIPYKICTYSLSDADLGLFDMMGKTQVTNWIIIVRRLFLPPLWQWCLASICGSATSRSRLVASVKQVSLRL